MNIRRLEVLSMSALFWVVLAVLPPWQHLGHLTRETVCRFHNAPSALAVEYGLAFQVGNLPMLIFGILLVTFGLALLAQLLMNLAIGSVIPAAQSFRMFSRLTSPIQGAIRLGCSADKSHHQRQQHINFTDQLIRVEFLLCYIERHAQ
jgi:hypothetical protein